MKTMELKNRLALYRHQQRLVIPSNHCPGCGALPLFAASASFARNALDFASASDFDLLALFKLPPEKAIEYFKAKGYAISYDWREVWQEAQATAFTVAKAMRLDILQTIRDELQTALDEGMMLRDFQKNLQPKLEAMGWWGKREVIDREGVVSLMQMGSPQRLRIIYETNMRTSYQAGHYRDMMETRDEAPYGQFIAVLDQNTRPAHRALHGQVFLLTDPFWDTHWPPLDWGCRCSVRRLSERDVRRRGLTISGGEGNLTDMRVTMDNGEQATVTAYRDPKTGAVTATGPGWNYNPGMVNWQPDLGKYDADIAKLW